MGRWTGSGVVALVALLVLTGQSAAVPPPPPNPSDSEISEGREAADAAAARVGELNSKLSEAESRLQALDSEVAYKMELANKARVDLDIARTAADTARAEADSARAQSDASFEAVERSRRALDEFAAASYEHGSALGSVTAYFGATSPEDLLARAQLLEAVGGFGLDTLDDLHEAQDEAANKDSAARAARGEAEKKEKAADDAQRAAEGVMAAAVQAQRAQREQAGAIEQERGRVQGELEQALGSVEGLESQRERYGRWLEDKRREDAAAAAFRPPAVIAPPVGGGSGGPVGEGVEAVIARAMTQIGVRYSWGGGNYTGPTVGVRDGGEGDVHGDYYTVGFDCSGLMMYAFAGVGIYLPHYSGYQYTSGDRVPLEQARRGDMLFWGPGGGTHVALYLGDGMMLEAPYSGSAVKVSPVRYSGIVPYVTRLL
ncbi:NlpC/P60 family protein [Actinosynnema pretiosum]|uniref:Hydrolase n=1 Tax=Actinosynnema pretiosum TaxID=42197 RepID=A0A290Z459_9PSEU|nr:hydrolase [Actinosynnema pretiosum]